MSDYDEEEQKRIADQQARQANNLVNGINRKPKRTLNPPAVKHINSVLVAAVKNITEAKP